MKTKTSIRKKILIAPAILLFALFFNLSIGSDSIGSTKLSSIVSASSKTYALSGSSWTDARASAGPCNIYCENLGYDKGAITVSASKSCAGATCSYISDFNTGEQSEISNDGNCGCSYQFTCACSNNEIKKPDLIVKDAYIEPKNPTTDDTVCLYATIKNIGTEDVELHDLTSWTYVNDLHAANTFYGKSLAIGGIITKEIFCSKYGDNVWFVKGKNTIKINIDPESVNIVDELNEENNEKVLSFEIVESVPEAVCGNGICEENESPYSCKADCAAWEEVFDTEKCTTWHAPNVFNYSPCGDTKIYNVVPGEPLRLSAYGDNCASCVCYHVNFDLYDNINGEWIKVKTVDEPDEKTGIRNIFSHTPAGSKIKIVGTSGCFHFNLYKESGNNIDDDETVWDVSIKFDEANKASFYPFSENEGETGKIYYSKLNESDNLYEEYVGGECCEYWSNSYYYNKYEEEQVKRAKGWYAERKKISDNKYKLSIKGIAWADCAYSGYGYAKGELNLNSDGNWKISEVVKCSVSGSNKGQKTYCETGDKSVKFAAGSTCGGCCACADSAGINIEVIVERGDSNNSDSNSDSDNDLDSCLPDGTLIKLPNDPKIYVIKNCKKQWVRTAEEFRNNGYKWSDVKDTSKEVVDAYADYLEATANLLRAVGHNRIYRVINGRILWVPTVSAFNAQGLKWEDVQSTNETDINNYPQAKLIKAKGDDRIFYVTNSGIKKHIINGEVFNSYNNKHSDVVEVSPEIISSFYTANLFKDQNGNKVYKIEGNEKRWIKSAEAFRRYNFNWNKIVPANNVELNAYIDGESIE